MQEVYYGQTSLEKPCQATTNGLSLVEGGYKTLEFPFYRKGFNHELIERHGLTCIVLRKSVAYGHSHFEVVQLQERFYVRFDDRRELQPAELYPASSEWGTYGFTYRTLDEARKRFEKLAPTTAMAKQPLSPYSRAIKTAPTLEADAGLGQFEFNFSTESERAA
jgi:hypothetical protein